MNLKVTNNKFFLVGLITLAMALIFSPFVSMHVLTDFIWWQIIAAYAFFTVPAMAGLAVLYHLWPRFEMKTSRDASKQ